MQERNKINNQYKWDLTKLYSDKKDLFLDMDIVLEKSIDFSKMKNKILNNSDNLLNALNLYFEISKILEKIYVYCMLLYHQDMSQDDSKVLMGKAEKLNVKINENTYFFVPELLEKDYELINKYIEEKEELKKYEFLLKNIFREKKHVLSNKEEELLSKLSEVVGASDNTYDILSNVDLSFDKITKDKKDIQLNESNFIKFMKDKDRGVRKQAFDTLYKSYDAFKNTFASTFMGNIKSDSCFSKIRKYESALESSLFSNNIDINLYDKLINTVNEKQYLLHDYVKLRKEILNLEELHIYDLYVSLIDEPNKDYSYEDAKDIVVKSLSVLGDGYIDNVNKFFDSKCVDVFHNDNKQSGAYSCGCYGNDPYILMNYDNTFSDVSTLAHELGHSMHTLYSNNNNLYHDASYTIFLAEIASLVNEIILNRFMYKNADKKEEKLYYLNNLLEMIKSTLYRQTMFAEFERDVHALDEKGEVLTESKLSSMYYDLNKKYYGDDLIHDDAIRLEWIRISHFYNSFYVYKYATGISCAFKIAYDILNGKENAKENYLKFLSSGGSNYSLEILNIINIDIVNDNTIDDALDIFEKTLKEFKDLL